MKAERPYPQVHITPKGQRALQAGHPWVYAGEAVSYTHLDVYKRQTRPLRRITLHFSHMGFTDGLTFILINLLLTTPGNPAPSQIVRGHFHCHLVTGRCV